jgi:hypothetical protein
MKKNLFLVVVLLVLVVTVKAQVYDEKPIKIGVGAVVGLPMDAATGYYNLAYGVDALGEYRISNSFALTLNIGYTDLNKKSGVIQNRKLIYGLAGVKYYIADKFYGGLQAGIRLKASSGMDTKFILTPAIGMNITKDIDLSIRYQSQVEQGYNYSFIGLLLGVRIIYF